MGPEARRTQVPAASRKKTRPKKAVARPVKKAPASKSRPPAKRSPPPAKATSPATEAPAMPVAPRPGDSRRHVLSLSFLRDGDEFFARMETDSGQITELKNRSLDQLLTLVASELEDLLE